MRFFLLFATLALTTGCTTVGCDFRTDDSANGFEGRCQDRTGLDAAAFGATCEALGAIVVSGPCDNAGAFGKCALGGDNPLTNVKDWYFDPEDPAGAAQECDDDGGVWTSL